MLSLLLLGVMILSCDTTDKMVSPKIGLTKYI